MNQVACDFLECGVELDEVRTVQIIVRAALNRAGLLVATLYGGQQSYGVAAFAVVGDGYAVAAAYPENKSVLVEIVGCSDKSCEEAMKEFEKLLKSTRVVSHGAFIRGTHGLHANDHRDDPAGATKSAVLEDSQVCSA